MLASTTNTCPLYLHVLSTGNSSKAKATNLGASGAFLSIGSVLPILSIDSIFPSRSLNKRDREKGSGDVNQFLLTPAANTCPSSQHAGFVDSVVNRKEQQHKGNQPRRPPRRLSLPCPPCPPDPAERGTVREKASGQAIQPRTFTTTRHFHSMSCRRRGDGRGQRVEERGERRAVSGEWREP